jgi:hypothetical protein
MYPEANGQQKTAAKRMTSQKMQPCQKILTLPAVTAVMGAFIYDVVKHKKGHSTIMWTKFDQTLTTYQLEWTIVDILNNNYPLFP